MLLNRFVGAWEEQKVQDSGHRDPQKPYRMRIKITAALLEGKPGDEVGTTDYPTHPGSGVLALVEVSGERLVLHETITKGANRKTLRSDGRVTLTPRGSSLRYEWLDPNGRYRSAGNLKRGTDPAGAPTDSEQGSRA